MAIGWTSGAGVGDRIVGAKPRPGPRGGHTQRRRAAKHQYRESGGSADDTRVVGALGAGSRRSAQRLRSSQECANKQDNLTAAHAKPTRGPRWYRPGWLLWLCFRPGVPVDIRGGILVLHLPRDPRPPMQRCGGKGVVVVGPRAYSSLCGMKTGCLSSMRHPTQMGLWSVPSVGDGAGGRMM